MTSTPTPTPSTGRTTRLAYLESIAGQGSTEATLHNPATARELELLQLLRDVVDAMSAGRGLPRDVLREATSPRHKQRAEALVAAGRKQVNGDAGGGAFALGEVRELALLLVLIRLFTSTPDGGVAPGALEFARAIVYGADLYEDDHGWRAHVVADDGRSVTFGPEGGGPVQTLAALEFHTRFTPTSPRRFQRGTVAARFLKGTLPCWTDGSTWEGFGKPYFERAEVDWLVASGIEILRWEGDTVVQVTGSGPRDRQAYAALCLPDGTQVWGVGAGHWLWDQVRLDARDAAVPAGPA